jgi:hypothetical protein
MLRELVKSIKDKLPLEFKRDSSLKALFIFYILLRIVEGVLSRAGELILENSLYSLPKLALEVWKPIYFIFSYPIRVNLFQLCLFLLFAVPAYKLIDRVLQKKAKKEVVFEDNFDFGNKGWRLNYWGSNNPSKTCRIEQSAMVFEAEDSDLTNPKKENGAYFDLGSGIYKDSKYEISCWAKSNENTKMGFKLWVHDTKGHGEMRYPANFYTPGSRNEEVKIGFIGTQSQALRIHLHYKAGKGKISVSRVRVMKV